MRYRLLDGNGDYTFGRGGGNFIANSPATVAQSVLTRLKLYQGEWFLDRAEGTPWLQQVLSAQARNTVPLYDQAIRMRVLRTPGVTGIATYSSHLDTATRALSVDMTVDTEFGQAQLSVVI